MYNVSSLNSIISMLSIIIKNNSIVKTNENKMDCQDKDFIERMKSMIKIAIDTNFTDTMNDKVFNFIILGTIIFTKTN